MKLVSLSLSCFLYLHHKLWRKVISFVVVEISSSQTYQLFTPYILWGKYVLPNTYIYVAESKTSSFGWVSKWMHDSSVVCVSWWKNLIRSASSAVEEPFSRFIVDFKGILPRLKLEISIYSWLCVFQRVIPSLQNQG